MLRFVMSYPCSKNEEGERCQQLDQKLLNKKDVELIPPLHDGCYCYVIEEEEYSIKDMEVISKP